MAVIRQPSFSGGELAPGMWGRTDLPIHARGLRTCRNFFIARDGSAVSRPGTSYVVDTKDGAARAVRLVPFIYSDSQSYVLEFGHQYIRFISNGVQVKVAGVPVEVVTTYAEADLPRLKFAQSGDVLTIVHPSYPPRELTRTSHTSWAIANVVFDRPAPDVRPRIWLPLPVEDATHPAREWQYKATEIYRHPSGYLFETAPYACTEQVFFDGYPWDATIAYPIGSYATEGGTQYRALTANTNRQPSTRPGDWVADATVSGASHVSAAPTKFARFLDRPVNLILGSSGAGLLPYPFIGYRIYIGRGGLYGWIGDSRNSDWKDVGKEPDYTLTPPQGINPFKVYDSAGVLLRTEYPSAVAYFEERRVFADTSQRPSYLFFSKTADYANHDRPLIPVEDSALEFDIAARKREEIRGLVPLEKLLLLTNSAVWSFGGQGGEALTPGNATAKRHIDVGSSWLEPLLVGNTVLMARSKGAGVRDVLYDLQQQSYSGGELSTVARHLFENYTLTDWTYAEDPWGVVWAVRSDGKLLSLTYDRDAQMAAWARHDTQGTFECVCAVPETTEDAVYVVVKRTRDGVDVRCIERMASRTLPLDGNGNPDTTRTVALDCSVTVTGSNLTSITGLSALEGMSVMVLGDGNVFGPYQVVAGKVDISADAPDGVSRACVGLAYDCDLETLDLSEERTRQKSVSAVWFEVTSSRGGKAGESLTGKLVEWKQRAVSDGYSAVTAGTGLVQVYVKSAWNRGARAAIRQSDPLFLTVYAVHRQVEAGET